MISLLLFLLVCSNCFMATYSEGSGAFIGRSIRNAKTAKLKRGICTTQECKKAAKQISSSMDTSADPCTDFFQYACGGWIEKNPIPDKAAKWSQFNLMRANLSKSIGSILSEPVNSNDPVPLNQAKWMYTTCINEEKLESTGVAPLVNILQSLGGWPLATGTWSEEGFDWKDAVAQGRKLFGMQNFIGISVYADEKDTYRSAIYIDQTTLGMPMTVFASPEQYTERIQAYKTYINVVGSIIAHAQESQIFDGSVDELFNFETQLAAISTPGENRRDKKRLYNPMKLSELEKLTEQKIEWVSLLNQVFSGVDITVGPNTVVIVREVEYFKKLATLIAETDKRVIANYLLWRFVKDLGDQTTGAMRNAFFNYKTVVLGVTEAKPRTEICAETTNKLLGMAVGFPYVKRFFTENAKKESKEILKNIRKAFQDLLKKSKWMDRITKKRAIEKANGIADFVGYPAWYDKPNGLVNYYFYLSGITSETGHFENFRNARFWKSSEELKGYGLLPDRSHWNSPPTTINAFYKATFNSITFPAGILQWPFYRANTLKAINYGGIGQFMGHEITHGFDDQGRQSDVEGNARNWWTESTLNAFKKRTQCIVNQYNNYQMPNIDSISVNGVTTQGENIADNGGLRAAYFAYQKFLKKNGPEPSLPGLEKFTSNQIFFLSAANVWCAKITDEALKNKILVDPHSPSRFRVRGAMSNMVEFSKEWKCAPKSNYNPEKKCTVW